VDCDGNTVPGSVVVYSNSASNHNGYLTTDEAGSWSLALPCMSAGSLSLTATSPDDFTQSNDYTVVYDIVENNVYDANSISLCEGEIVNTYMTYNDGINEITFTQVEMTGFNPGTWGCSELIATNPGAESTDFISGLGLASLNSDSLNFSVCTEDFQVRGYLASGEYLVLETPGGAESSWVEVIQYIEGENTNLLEASFSLYFDTFIEEWPVEIYTDDSMTTLADEYNIQSTSITFLVLYE
ncbi:MAG TPA: hypothetical protein VJ949_09930, partial [Cryomorphaceae bacterium]|nr:hypothetical protein [Cryomorphaceae bacterium]